MAVNLYFSLFGVAKPFLEVVNGVYRCGIGLVKDCHVVTDPIAEEDEFHHLAQFILVAALDNLMADAVLFKQLACYLVANQCSWVERRAAEQDYI